MTDRENVIKRLEECLSASCRGFRTCPYSDNEWDAVETALTLLREHPIMADWKRLKFSVLETANNNASEGNEDVYRILTWVAQMMDNYEKRWPKGEADRR